MWKKNSVCAVKETCLEKRNATIIYVYLYIRNEYINRKPNDWSMCTCAAAAAMNSYTVIFKRLCVCVKIVFRLPLPCLRRTIDELEWAPMKTRIRATQGGDQDQSAVLTWANRSDHCATPKNNKQKIRFREINIFQCFPQKLLFFLTRLIFNSVSGDRFVQT